MLGLPGSGKSSLLETIGCRYPKIIDLFGSRDNEGLAWCRSPVTDNILFITGESVEVKCKWDVIKVRELTLADIQAYDICLSVHAFYSSYDEEFHGMNAIIKTLWKRTHWRKPWYIMIREAANFIYSRIKIVRNQSIAKADFIHLLRELRHSGYAIGVDTIRWTAIDKEVRDVANYTVIKKVGVWGLPQDLRWLYRYITPQSIMNPPPSVFILVSNSGPVALGKFSEVPWHKKEKEDILTLLDITVEQGEVPEYADHRRSVGDFEHNEIIQEYLEVRSMHKVAAKFRRSSGTISHHIKEHNEEVKRIGACNRCRRAKRPEARTYIEV